MVAEITVPPSPLPRQKKKKKKKKKKERKKKKKKKKKKVISECQTGHDDDNELLPQRSNHLK